MKPKTNITATRSAPRRILVPVDFSYPSRQALSAAVALAQRFGSRLAVAQVTWNADFVVLDTHGRTGWKRGVMGRLAERVLQIAPCPVLVAR